MSFTRPSVQTELDRFYKALSKSSTSFESISKSAFTQARKKLKPETFIELNRQQLSYFDQKAPYKRDFMGKRVVAIDGSLLNLPHTEDIRVEFGGVCNQHEQVVSARCSFAYDVVNELVLDALIAPRRSCEKELAVGHLSQLNPSTDILVFDRGYPSQWLMGLLVREGYKFCFRLSTAWKDAYNQLDGSNEDIDWKMVRRSKKDLGKLREYGLPAHLEGLRLVSIPLSSDEKEVLVTNLMDRSQYSIDRLNELYHLRWGVEEGYKAFKKVLHIEHFTGRSTQSIKQDFHARVLMLNMATMIRTQGLPIEKQRKQKTQLNKTQTIAKTKDFMVNLFYFKCLRKTITQILHLLKGRMEVVRPNRSFVRYDTSSRRRHIINNSKGI